MVKNKLEALIGLAGLTVALAGCPGDDTGSDTTTTTPATSTTGMESTGGDTMTEPPETGSSSGGGDTTTGDPMDCDPPCPAGEECVEGACFPVMCDPPCGADQMCVAGVCEDMPPPAGSDYGPCDMCAPGESQLQFEGVDGCWCSPACDAMTACPAPNEGTADAQCVITTMAGADPTQCALVCMGDEECPTGASCIDVGGGTICMHPPSM